MIAWCFGGLIRLTQDTRVGQSASPLLEALHFHLRAPGSYPASGHFHRARVQMNEWTYF